MAVISEFVLHLS